MGARSQKHLLSARHDEHTRFAGASLSIRLAPSQCCLFARCDVAFLGLDVDAASAWWMAADWARRLEDAEMPLLKHLIRTLVREVRVESRASIRPVIHLPMVRVTSRWVGRQGLEPCPPD